MNTKLRTLLALTLCLMLLLPLLPAALAEGGGGTDPEEESLIDEEALNQWIGEYRKAHDLEHDWQDVSIGFCYTATGDCWYYNADIFMYSASLYKVPVCMMVAEKEAAGEITQDTKIQGSTVRYLESSALIQSNNDSGHVLVSFLGGTYQGKCSGESIAYTQLEGSYFEQDFFDHSYYTARYMTQVMLTLHEGGEERFPHVLEYLQQAQPEEYLNLRLKGTWELAQKYGAYAEKNGYNNNHIAAIVYTPTPVIIVVMTRNVGDYQNRIAEIGEYLANYSLVLDELRAQREQQAAEDPAPSEGPEPAENTGAPGSAAEPSGQTGQTAQPGAELSPRRDRRSLAGWAIVLAGGLALCVVAVEAGKEKRRKRRRAAAAAGGRRRR